MAALDIKLLRDIRRLWAQVLAIALVVGGGVATLVLAVGSHRSLEETRTAYYERYAFADVFARVRRAPKALVGRIAEIPGVAAVDPRIARLALLTYPASPSRRAGSSFQYLTPAITASTVSTSARAGSRSPGAPKKLSSTSRLPAPMASPKDRAFPPS